MIYLYDELKINQKEAIVFPNQTIEKIRKYSFYPIIIFLIFLSYMVIKYDNIGIFRYIVIPFCILIIICLKYNIKSNEHLLKTYKFKVDKNSINYYCQNDSKLTRIPIERIISIEDKSVYYDFRGRGNSGWDHSFKIKILRGKEFLDNINKKTTLIYEYFEDDNYVELEIYDLDLEHEDYLKLIHYIKSCMQNNIK